MCVGFLMGDEVHPTYAVILSHYVTLLPGSVDSHEDSIQYLEVPFNISKKSGSTSPHGNLGKLNTTLLCL